MPQTKKGKKMYVLDTNVLITDPYALFAFDEHDVCLVDITLEELDNLKTQPGEIGANAREATRIMKEMRERGSILNGVKLKPDDTDSGSFHVEVNHVQEELPEGWADKKADHRILRTCKALNRLKGGNVILVTNDNITLLKADIIEVQAEEYRTNRVSETDKQYKGRREMFVKSIDGFYSNGFLEKDAVYYGDDEEYEPLCVNEFLTMKDAYTGNSALGRFDGERIVPLKHINSTPFGVTPKNSGQRFAFEALMAPASEAPLVIIKGGAGTAKTFCGLAAGLEQVLGNEELYRRVLIARPNIKFDEDIGFLKGSEQEKIAPLIRPVMDNLEILVEHLSGKKIGGQLRGKDTDDNMTTIEYLFKAGFITAEALAYFRGRSISKTYILIDEAQNMTPNQAFGIVTRAGVGSKIVIVGDPTQIDNLHIDSRTNGLSYASEKMKGNPLCWQVTFTDEECTRSKLATEAIASMSPKGIR